MALVPITAYVPTTDGPLAAKLLEHDNLLAANTGTIATAVASATTITLPDDGRLIPITGTTTIDFITVPTGGVGRVVTLWIQTGLIVRQEVASAPAGAANVVVVQGGTVNSAYLFSGGSLLSLQYDGTQWKKFPTGPHWDGANMFGSDATAKLLIGGSGISLERSSTSKLSIGSSNLTLTFGSSTLVFASASTNLTSPAPYNISARTGFTQGSVASASNVTFPMTSSVLVTGVATMNTFTATSWTEGAEVSLEFDGILTITNNSGGANDFVSKDGNNITTSAGMVLKFRYDGTDLREIGR